MTNEEINFITHVEIKKELSKESYLIVDDDFNLDTIENKVPTYILKKAEDLFKENFNSTDSIDIIIDKLITLLIKTQDGGYNFIEIKQLINQYIFYFNQILN